MKKIVARVIVFAVLAWGIYGALQGDWSVFQTLLNGVAVGFAILLAMLPLNIKRAFIKGYSSPSYRPARSDEFPRLDTAELERLTREWEELGFLQSKDVAGGEATPRLGIAFSRLMEHQTEGVLVEIAQQFLPTKTLPFSCNLVSFWGEDEREAVEQGAQNLQLSAATASPLASPDGSTPPQPTLQDANLKMWTLVTHNRAPNRLFALLRHPRVLGARLEKDASPAQLWQTHQQRVALVNARLGMAPLRGDLPALLHDHALVVSALCLRRLQKTSVWKIARVQFARKAPPPIFDGELAPLSV